MASCAHPSVDPFGAHQVKNRFPFNSMGCCLQLIDKNCCCLLLIEKNFCCLLLIGDCFFYRKGVACINDPSEHECKAEGGKGGKTCGCLGISCRHSMTHLEPRSIGERCV